VRIDADVGSNLFHDRLLSRALEYREDKYDTMIRGAYDRDLPSRGRFWIDTRSGAVLRSEMIAEDPTVSDRIEVTYAFDNTSS
jgi:hypothetical protein